MNGSKIILSAHRGDRLRFPENTMPAFISAEKAGVDMIETDIHMTKDGVLVIVHDRNAKRTCGFDGNFDEMEAAKVKKLDAGALFDEKFKGTEIPTAEEFCKWVSKTSLLINWELKDMPSQTGDSHAFAAADRLCEMIERYGLEERSMINSFSARVLEYVVKKYPKRFPIHGQGIGKAPKSCDTADMSAEELFDWCCLYSEDGVNSPVDFPDGFKHCLDNRIIPCVCIPDDEEKYKKAIEQGCRMFTSNNIYKADEILRKLGAREGSAK